MADDIDLANDLFANELSYALSKIRQNASQLSVGPKNCLECGDDMPEGRRTMGFKFCLSCAEERERKKSLFAD